MMKFKGILITNKKIIIPALLAFIVLILCVFTYLSLTSAPPSGSLIKSYNYIDGEFNKRNLTGVNKAYVEKVDIQYGKTVSNKNNKKQVEAVIKAPNMKGIVESAINKVSSNESLNYDEKLLSVQQDIISELTNANDCEMIEKAVTVTMTKDGLKWKIVSDDDFSEAIDGNLILILKENISKMNGVD